jgi:hypothetical protein
MAGFCGPEGFGFGPYAKVTREDLGCPVASDGKDPWTIGASRAPLLPEFARGHCSFFYGPSCWTPTVACRQ